MTTILILGGFGFYGTRVAQALRERGHEVTRASRRPRPGAVVLDLTDPTTFAALADFELVVNCSDSVGAPPDAAIAHVLAHGGTWMEMGADLVGTERLLAMPVPQDSKGEVFVGVGVFPGLSTALARAVAESGEHGCQRLELGIRLSPLSGAGRANCALMAESLFVPALRYEHGKRTTSRSAMGPAATLTFDGQPAPANNFALPDTTLIERCTGVPTVTTYFALVPAWLRFDFGALAWMAWLLRFARRPLVWLLTWQMILLRAWLLRRVETRVQLVAVADRGTPHERSQGLSFDDGQQSTALGVVAAVRAWERLPPHERRPGLFGLAERFTLEELRAGLEPQG
ncbi:NAD-dependent epimerase/dehydratase family protein [Paraliomyxa miuraensis]|uniref:NAD-dependent epimerase/dehydratase family protein n=1 Tax=Paraliomyxa miuraensis TaxID=376150 RepID=UPI002257EC74|nr:NAD-dependent epimerase/dehydratase family protein [Paraliomyxa miuraensis]MCX4243062.1 NAD-dependent epimerase/dehydratase family protein [Paraliomyxa miuraensis]